ncbi:MAG TPA: PDZ domain-containing protein [Caulobacteraceae bacterium]|nr:PDZ domain-containing protein [Caulobacteraceae bacterium]
MGDPALACGLVLILSGNADAARLVQTPSGRPDAIFRGRTAVQVQNQLASKCMDAGWTVTSSSTTEVVCEVPMSLASSFFANLLIGNSYSTPPREFIRFAIVQLGADSRAQANAWVETQMALGQVRQEPYTDDRSMDNLEFFMVGSGGALPPGTAYGFAYLGTEHVDVPRTADGRPAIGLQITKLAAGSPGDLAGIKIGDVVTMMNGKPIVSDAALIAFMNKLRLGSSYTVTLERAGQTLVLPVVAQAHPPVPDFAPTDAAPPPAAPTVAEPAPASRP